MASKIEHYALVGDCATAALIGRDGSVDWLCWPRFDAGACFSALLGTTESGRCLISAADQSARVTRRYRDLGLSSGTTPYLDLLAPGILAQSVLFVATRISHRDMVQFVLRCIDYPNYHFVTVYGLSNNLRSRSDNSNVKFLCYRPEDDTEAFATEILALGKKENEIAAQFHGGFYCPMEFAGDAAAIDQTRRRHC